VSNANERLLAILVSPFQKLQAVINDFRTKRSVRTSVGQQLEIVGSYVKQARGAIADDDTYRRYIQARAAVDRSSGVPEDLIRVAQLVLGDGTAVIKVASPGIATFTVDVTSTTIDQATADALLDLLGQAVSGGVRLELTYALVAPTAVFRYDTGPGYDVGHYAGAGDNT